MPAVNDVGSRVRENRMHGLTGGSWKQSHDQIMATEKNNPTGNRRVPVTL
jgi:hypothetical protein